jgi:hypothetical protein
MVNVHVSTGCSYALITYTGILETLNVGSSAIVYCPISPISNLPGKFFVLDFISHVIIQ